MALLRIVEPRELVCLTVDGSACLKTSEYSRFTRLEEYGDGASPGGLGDVISVTRMSGLAWRKKRARTAAEIRSPTLQSPGPKRLDAAKATITRSLNDPHDTPPVWRDLQDDVGRMPDPWVAPRASGVRNRKVSLISSRNL
jgi:hypothetical protein